METDAHLDLTAIYSLSIEAKWLIFMLVRRLIRQRVWPDALQWLNCFIGINTIPVTCAIDDIRRYLADGYPPPIYRMHWRHSKFKFRLRSTAIAFAIAIRAFVLEAFWFGEWIHGNHSVRLRLYSTVTQPKANDFPIFYSGESMLKAKSR